MDVPAPRIASVAPTEPAENRRKLHSRDNWRRRMRSRRWYGAARPTARITAGTGANLPSASVGFAAGGAQIGPAAAIAYGAMGRTALTVKRSSITVGRGAITARSAERQLHVESTFHPGLKPCCRCARSRRHTGAFGDGIHQNHGVPLVVRRGQGAETRALRKGRLKVGCKAGLPAPPHCCAPGTLDRHPRRC